MNPLPSSLHAPLRRQLSQCMRQSPARFQHRFFSAARQLGSRPPHAVSQAAREQHARHKRSMMLAGAGMIVSGVAMYGAVHYYYPDGVSVSFQSTEDDNGNGDEQDGKTVKVGGGGGEGTIKLDGPTGLDVDETPTLIIDGVEQVPTGNSTVPHFPKSIYLPRALESTGPGPGAVSKRQIGDEIKDNEGAVEEYRLLGLGIRTVSILSIQVYVVGMYIATSDLAALQQRLVRQGATPVTSTPTSDTAIAATSLVPEERESLKQLLLDPGKGEEVWDQLIKQGGVRTAFRIVPTRNTDFLHLRDGWVRSITGRAQKANAHVKDLAKKAAAAANGADGESKSVTAIPEPEFADDSFGAAMNDFKSLLGGGVRKNVPKGQTLLLLRDGAGVLELLYQPGSTKPFTWLGEVQDERIGRLLWEGYLAGKTVASEGARKSIVEGMMSIASRPVGTVDQRVL